MPSRINDYESTYLVRFKIPKLSYRNFLDLPTKYFVWEDVIDYRSKTTTLSLLLQNVIT